MTLIVAYFDPKGLGHKYDPFTKFEWGGKGTHWGYYALVGLKDAAAYNKPFTLRATIGFDSAVKVPACVAGFAKWARTDNPTQHVDTRYHARVQWSWGVSIDAVGSSVPGFYDVWGTDALEGQPDWDIGGEGAVKWLAAPGIYQFEYYKFSFFADTGRVFEAGPGPRGYLEVRTWSPVDVEARKVEA